MHAKVTMYKDVTKDNKMINPSPPLHLTYFDASDENADVTLSKNDLLIHDNNDNAAQPNFEKYTNDDDPFAITDAKYLMHNNDAPIHKARRITGDMPTANMANDMKKADPIAAMTSIDDVTMHYIDTSTDKNDTIKGIGDNEVVMKDENDDGK